jgi:dUTPase
VKPDRIIYMRDGINPSGYNSFNMIELQDILKAPGELDKDYKPEIAVALIDRKPTQKFFVTNNNNTTNP